MRCSPWEVAGPRGDLRGRSHYWMIVQMLQVLVLPVQVIVLLWNTLPVLVLLVIAITSDWSSPLSR